jgi:ParB family chromosome partitioning protein
MVTAGWVPTTENYLGRVTKARILEAVIEAKGEQAARRMEGLKKDAMAEAAAQMLAGFGWLPEALRTKGVETMVLPGNAGIIAMEPDPVEHHEQAEPHEIAAE